MIRFALLPVLLLAPPAFGQNCAQDAFEPNDTFAQASSIGTSFLTGLNIGNATESWDYDLYAITVPDGMDLVVTTFGTGAPPPTTWILEPNNFATNLGIPEPGNPDMIRASNSSGAPVERFVWVRRFPSGCVDYELDVALTAPLPVCATGQDDSFEPNESFVNPPALPSGMTTGLLAKIDNPDVYTISVPPQFDLRIDTTVPATIPQGNLVLLLYSVDPVTQSIGHIVDFDESQSNGDFLGTTNTSGVARDYILAVSVEFDSGAPCQRYDLNVQLSPNACASAGDAYDTPDPALDASTLGIGPFPTITEDDYEDLSVRVQAGSFPNLTVRSRDWDLWVVQVEPGVTLTADLSFVHAAGDIDLFMTDPEMPQFSVQSSSTTDDESASYTNLRQVPIDVHLVVSLTDWLLVTPPPAVRPYSALDICNDYELQLSFSAPPVFATPFCFASNAAAPCPCGNTPAPGTTSGCFNDTGVGATLSAVGSPVINPDLLSFELVGAQPNSFSILVSANNALPAGCQVTQSCGVVVFDGLRCVGGNLIRHGIRATTEFGRSSAPWENTASGFTAGTLRRFQAFYRTPLNSGCQTELNTSNAIEVTFAN